ncbi:hypothetical protein [Nonomuraea jabiensis]|uniref:hypothetical protein n=1 Tax=Nonomuraea jabiensis TaxID=882448 RepID=UPI003D744ACF
MALLAGIGICAVAEESFWSVSASVGSTQAGLSDALMAWILSPAILTGIAGPVVTGLDGSGRRVALVQASYIAGTALAPAAGTALGDLLGFRSLGFTLATLGVGLALVFITIAKATDRPQPLASPK